MKQPDYLLNKTLFIIVPLINDHDSKFVRQTQYKMNGVLFDFIIKSVFKNNTRFFSHKHYTEAFNY